MNRRDKITIDEMRCVGCEQCVKRCQGGALQLVDGKARLVNEEYCDGLGVCIGECPVGAITVEKVEVAKVSVVTTEQSKQSTSTPFMSLRAVAPEDAQRAKESADAAHLSDDPRLSQLTSWPVQLHLISHGSQYFNGADMLVAADCSAFAHPDFHNTILRGRKLVIACPKLDNNREVYIQKLKGLIDNSIINTITVAIMEVPCCSGLMQIVKAAVERSIRKVPIKRVVISVKGVVVSEEWL